KGGAVQTVVIIGTLDTKGPEIAYLRDRLRNLGLHTLVVDSGILGEPLDIEPDITRDEVAKLAGTDIEALRNAGSRGKAVRGMQAGIRQLALNLYREGRLDAVTSLGGAEGAVLAATAMKCLPVGIPKILVTPIASGRRRFGPVVGTRDVMVVHSVVDILGLNPISTAIFDNVAGALKGMLEHGHGIRPDPTSKYVAITMLGNTTKAVMSIRDELAKQDLEAVVFHSNGVGGPAMEELAADNLFVGVIDFTTDELTDELVGGFHAAGPQRLAGIGLLGLPQVVVPGCIDFSVHGPAEEVPASMKGRPVYDHNPEFTLVRTLPDEMIQLGHIFAEKLNQAKGPVVLIVPTEGLSIPNVSGGPFWNPEADAGFLRAIRESLRKNIQIFTYPLHINSQEFALKVANHFLALLNQKGEAN
ncbi:MAG: Tm-1-like ATP-binding domain-containing protein, partial [Acidobacteriota bacterium]